MIIQGTTAVHLVDKPLDQTTSSCRTLEGWLTSETYTTVMERSIVVAPLVSTSTPYHHRLGPDGTILYSSLDGINKTKYGHVFEKIESHFRVNLVYGFQSYFHPITRIGHPVETLLVDVQHMSRATSNACKRELFEAYGIQSHRFEHLWEYEQSVRLASPTIASLEAIDALDDMTSLISHNCTGIPTLLCARQKPLCHATTVFCAHEVPFARQIIEEHPGHDTMFYNVMDRAVKEHLHIDDIFGAPQNSFKHTLTQATRHCHQILSVGDSVAQEMHFLSSEFEGAAIDTVYSGLFAKRVNRAEVRDSKEKLQSYCEKLLSYKPDWIFSHVATQIKSSALWRDLRVLAALDREFQKTRETGVLFMLCTDATQKPARDILQMEANYQWPIAHREGVPDLIGDEIPIFDAVQTFNARARNIKVLFINQDGFDRQSCGQYMPEDMTKIDLFQGTDVQFGLSIYQPSSTSHLESLAYGSICVLNRAGNRTELIENMSHEKPTNIIVADYTNIGDEYQDVLHVLRLGQSERDQIEQTVCRQLAQKILDKLPKNEDQAEALLQAGSTVAQKMSWDTMIREHLCPALQNKLFCVSK